MKYKAHVGDSLDSKTVYIQDVVKKLREQPKESERQKYYSLWYLTPMKAVCGAHKRPHFAFINASTCNPYEKQHTGMSIEHSTVQQWIEINKRVSLSHGYSGQKQYGKITFSEIQSEHRFNSDENGEIEYIADLYGKIETDNILGLESQSFLVIEIYKTSKVSKFKQKYFRKHNIAAIEVAIWDKVKFNVADNNPVHAMDELNSITNNWLNKGASFTWLHNPNFKSVIQEKNEPQSRQIIDRPAIISTPIPPLITKPEIATPVISKVEVEVDNRQNKPLAQNQSIFQRFMYFIRAFIKC